MDLISRQAAIDVPEKFIKDCNPEHFVGNQKFIEYMDDAEISSFGNWQFANGFNMGLTAAEVAIKKLPSAQPSIDPVKHGKWEMSRSEYGNIVLIKCSECHFEYPMLLAHMFRYCPNCGANMKGESDG